MDTVINNLVYPEPNLQKTGRGVLVMYHFVYGPFYSESCQAIGHTVAVIFDIIQVPTFTFLLGWWDVISLLNPHRCKNFCTTYFDLKLKPFTPGWNTCVWLSAQPRLPFMGHISCSCHLKVIQQLYTITIIFCVWMRHNSLWQNVNILMSWALLLLLVIINSLITQSDHLFYGCCMKVTLTCTLHPVLPCMFSLHRLHPWDQALR